MAAPFTPEPAAVKPGTVKPVTLWDPVVRLTHWSIAAVVLTNAVLTEGGSAIHIWAGWIGLGCLALRLLWGLVGPTEARFTSFPPSISGTVGHIASLAGGKAQEHPGHNPAGAAMAYALWGTLAVLMITGLVMTGGKTPMQMDEIRASVAAGDWSVLVDEGDSGEKGEKDNTLSEAAKEVHEMAGNLILFLVLLHVGGVVLESRLLRRNLVKPMLFGVRK